LSTGFQNINYMLLRLKFKYDIIIEQLLDSIPEEIWRSDTTTFYDPSIGGGQIVKSIEARLRKYSHSDDNIKNRVYGSETNKLRLKYSINKHKLIGNYNSCNSDFKFDGFDVIVSNPIRGTESIVMLKNMIENSKPDAIISIIQQAWILDKKNIRKAYSELKNNIVGKIKSIKIFNGNYHFGTSSFLPSMILTIDKKGNCNNIVLNNLMDNTIFNFTDINNINLFSDNKYYFDLCEKILNISNISNFESHLYSESNSKKKYFIKIPNVVGAHDNKESQIIRSGFYTMKTSNVKYEKYVDQSFKNTDMVFYFDTIVECNNFLDYISSNICKFCLSIYKINQNCHRGELKSIPWLNFKQKINKEYILSYFKLTESEYEYIINLIQKY
jgi:hypothetical protein